MTQLYKKINLLLLLTLSSFMFATTGIEEFMPTSSGEYVYYRDYTFHTETYVGFICYDENTYGMRYYAINPKVGSEEVELLVTLDPTQNVPVFSGEKIITQTVQEDIESVNYLHELFYEFSARRTKQNGKVDSKILVVSDEFQQFGGQMTVTYDAYIPIFNLSSIKDKSGEVLFEVQSIGRHVDNNDTSFFDFKVADFLVADAKSAVSEPVEIIAPKERQKVVFDNFSIELDTLWEKKLENLWTLGNNALLSVSKIRIPSSDFTRFNFSLYDYFTRQFLTSAQGTALLLPETIVTKDSKTLMVASLVYANLEKLLSRQVQMLLQSTSNTDEYYVVTLTVYDSSYQVNKNYFDSIIESIK